MKKLLIILFILCTMANATLTSFWDPYAAHIPDDINLGTVAGQMLHWVVDVVGPCDATMSPLFCTCDCNLMLCTNKTQ